MIHPPPHINLKLSIIFSESYFLITSQISLSHKQYQTFFHGEIQIYLRLKFVLI